MTDSINKILKNLDTSIYQSSMHTYQILKEILPEKELKLKIFEVFNLNMDNLDLKIKEDSNSDLQFLNKLESKFQQKVESSMNEGAEKDIIFYENILSTLNLIGNILEEESYGNQ